MAICAANKCFTFVDLERTVKTVTQVFLKSTPFRKNGERFFITVPGRITPALPLVSVAIDGFFK